MYCHWQYVLPFGPGTFTAPSFHRVIAVVEFEHSCANSKLSQCELGVRDRLLKFVFFK